MCGWNVAQWRECLSSMHEDLGAIPSIAYDQENDSA